MEIVFFVWSVVMVVGFFDSVFSWGIISFIFAGRVGAVSDVVAETEAIIAGLSILYILLTMVYFGLKVF